MHDRYIVLADDFKPMRGGIAEYLHHLWNEVGKSADVTIFSCAGAVDSEQQPNYSLHHLPAPPRESPLGLSRVPLVWRVDSSIRRYLMHKYAWNVARRIANRGRPAHCFVGSWSGELSHYWCAALRTASVRYSIFAYGLEFVTAKKGLRREWLASDFQSAERIYAASGGTARLIESTIGTKIPISVVNPGVDISAPGALASRDASFPNDWRVQGKRVVLSVCRLVERKGLDLAIKAVAGLVGEFPDLCYVIAGAGPARADLEKLAALLGVGGHVQFVGEVSDSSRQALYEASEFFVMPNRDMNGNDWEGFGIVFLEAAAAGKPSIGGNNGGVSDAIVDGVTGFLVDTATDEKSTLAAMRMLLQDNERRMEMGRAARRRARGAFSWERVARNFVSTPDHANQVEPAERAPTRAD